MSGFLPGNCKFNFEYTPSKKTITFRFFVFILQDAQIIGGDDLIEKSLESYKRLPENDEYNVIFQFNIGLLTQLALNKVKRDFQGFREKYYELVFNKMLHDISFNRLKTFTLNLDSKHLVCFTNVGGIIRQENKLFCYSD